MIQKFREFKRMLLNTRAIKKAYQYDCYEYSQWQYHNPTVKSKNALESKILRQAHVIEKGMSLSHPREKFGIQKARDLLDYIDEFEKMGFKIEESSSVKNAMGVIAAYLAFHEQLGFVPIDVVQHFEHISYKCPVAYTSYGVKKVKLEDLKRDIEGKFPAFFASRHSVRQFSDQEIDVEDIKNVMKLAMHAPSACNRQCCKVYFYQDQDTNEALADLIAGNTGFDKEVKHYLVVTSDMSSFYDAFERNQIYVDGGIFALSLVEALHYYGIASCILQNGEYKEHNLKIKKICGNIPENEKIILFIAIGYYKEEVVYATSHRKQLEEVLIIK